MAGLIKTVMAIKHKKIPPTINYKHANSQIDFDNSRFYVNTEIKDWVSNGAPRRAGVSSFGIGGTNAHIVLEEASLAEAGSSHRQWRLLLLSAKTSESLQQAGKNIKTYLHSTPDINLVDVEYTLQVGREAYNHRRFIVCDTTDSAVIKLDSDGVAVESKVVDSNQTLPIVFMFPGQGSQYVNMARSLYEQEPTYRECVDHCADILLSHIHTDIRTIIYPDHDDVENAKQRLNHTEISQPALFVIEYALAKLWMSWGVIPSSMIGHSVGEYVAACISGVFSLEDGLKLISARGRVMQTVSAGKMLSVLLEKENLVPLLIEHKCDLAAVNGTGNCVASGTISAIEALKLTLDGMDISNTELNTSHAFHSSMMDGILGEYRNVLETVTFNKLSIPIISNLKGEVATDGLLQTVDYWLKHLRNTVEFSQGIATLLRDTPKLFLEVGPGLTLGSLTKRHPQFGVSVAVASTPHQYDDTDDEYFLLRSLGQLWQQGLAIDWSEFNKSCMTHRISLPTYAFDRKRYWVDSGEYSSVFAKNNFKEMNQQSTWAYLPKWKRVSVGAGQAVVEKSNKWLVFVSDLEIGNQLIRYLTERGQSVVCVKMGGEFIRQDSGNYSITPDQLQDYEQLFHSLKQDKMLPEKVLHLWSVRALCNEDSLSYETFLHAQKVGADSAILLAKALVSSGLSMIDVNFVANNVYSVTGFENVFSENSSLAVIGKVITQETPEIECYYIDIDIEEATSSKQSDKLVSLIWSETTSENRQVQVAIRGLHRLVLEFEHTYDNKEKLNSPRIIHGGVYIITGGVGQIGLNLADHLARQAQAKIVLIGRSGFPSKSEWDSWLTEKGEHNPISVKISRMQRMEEGGAEVFVYCADVSNYHLMNEIFESVENNIGEINGVIHAAGEVNNVVKPFQEVTKEDFSEQYKSKVVGVLVLDRILRNRKIDFCLLMSSINAFIGGVGFSTYASANIFMDSFAQNKYAHGNETWFSVNWDRWNFDDSVERKKELSNLDGVKAFDYLMSIPYVPQVLISKVNPMDEVGESIEEVVTEVNPTETSRKLRTVENEYVAPRNKMERELVEVWEQVLGVGNIGITDNFFLLGGHSLFAIHVVSRMKELGIKVLFKELVASPTIEGISLLLESRVSESIDSYQYQYKSGDPIYSIPNRQLLFKAVFRDHWNQSGMLNISHVNCDAVREALKLVLTENQGLQHVFHLDNGMVREKIIDPGSDILEVVDFTHITDEHELKKSIEHQANDLQATLDLTSKLCKFVIFYCGENEPARFFWIVHHSLMDGYSIKLFVQEFFMRYLHLIAGKEFNGPAKTTSVSEWGNYLHYYVNSKEIQSDVNYWVSLPWNKIGTLMDYPDGLIKNQSHDPNNYGNDIVITKTLAENYSSLLLNNSPSAENFTSTNIIMTAFTNAISMLTESSCVRFDLVVNGRDKIIRNVDLDKTIGWLIDNIPVVIEVDEKLSPAEKVNSYQRQLSAIPGFGLTYNGLKYLSENDQIRTQIEATGDAEFNINIVPPALLKMDQIDLTGLPAHLISLSRESVGRCSSSELTDIKWPSYILVSFRNDKYEFTWMCRDNIYKDTTIENALNLWIQEIVKLIELKNLNS